MLGEINKLPSSDIEVLLSPLLRVRAGVSSCSKMLYPAILISPSNPGTPQNACILRGAPFGLSSPVFETSCRPLTLKCC